MRLLIVGVFISAIVQAQLPPGGPAPVIPFIDAGRFQALIVKQVALEYPSGAQSLHLAGDILLTVHLDPSGNLQNIKAVKGPAMLREAAMKAVMQWRFRPYLRDGIAMAVQSEVVIQFPPQ